LLRDDNGLKISYKLPLILMVRVTCHYAVEYTPH